MTGDVACFVVYLTSVHIIEMLLKFLKLGVIKRQLHLLLDFSLSGLKVDWIATVRQKELTENVLENLTGAFTVLRCALLLC